jgi:hypothetical protein
MPAFGIRDVFDEQFVPQRLLHVIEDAEIAEPGVVRNAVEKEPHVGCQLDGSLSGGRDEDANPKSDGTHNMHDWLMAAKVDVNHETEIANLH